MMPMGCRSVVRSALNGYRTTFKFTIQLNLLYEQPNALIVHHSSPRPLIPQPPHFLSFPPTSQNPFPQIPRAGYEWER